MLKLNTDKANTIETAIAERRPELIDFCLTTLRRTGLAKKHIDHKELAKDLVQDACEIAYSKYEEYELGRSPIAWIKGILIHVIKNRTRRHNLNREIQLNSFAQGTLRNQIQDRIELSALESKIDYENAKKQLSAKSRIVLDLYAQGYTGKDLAKELTTKLDSSVSEGNAYVLVHRARKELQEAWNKLNSYS